MKIKSWDETIAGELDSLACPMGSDGEIDEYQRMKLALLLYRPRTEVADAIHAAYHDPLWDWRKCDGCTAVCELHSPKGTKFWPCVLHDHQCELVRRGLTTRWKGDLLFFKAMVDYGVPRVMGLPWRTASGRWFGVRMAWIFWLSWKK